MSTTFAIKIAAMLLFLCGCSQEGYDLQLKADSFPNRVDIVIDYKNGQTPLAVQGVEGRDTYEIEVDPNGRAAINCTWPISRGHRTFVVLPDKTMCDTLTFSMKLGGVIMAKSNGKSSSGSDDGTVYWYELSRPSDTKQNDNGNRSTFRSHGAVFLSGLLLVATASFLTDTILGDDLMTELQSATYTDRTGDLKEDILYQFRDGALREGDKEFVVYPVPADKSNHELAMTPFERTGKAALDLMNADRLQVDVSVLKWNRIHGCAKHDHHETGVDVEAEYFLAKNGPIKDLVQNVSGETAGYSTVISGQFAERLRLSGLTGFKLIRIPPARTKPEYDPSNSQLVPPELARRLDLHLLRFVGQACTRPMALRVANQCPYCRTGPVICPDCGFMVRHKCHSCGNRPVYMGTRQHYLQEHGDEAIRPILSSSDPKVMKADRGFPLVVDGDRYDGSDFVYPQFISKRALDWLKSEGVENFYVMKVQVDVNGMPKEVRKKAGIDP